MDKNLINKLFKNFEEIRQEKEWSEFWSARELQILLGYTKWENFSKVLEKAKYSCFEAKQSLGEHFLKVGKTSEMPNGWGKEIEEYLLTRYACYLVAQNWDPRKSPVAFAQAYFALQTRKQELIEQEIWNRERLSVRKKLIETEKEFQSLAFKSWVDGQGVWRIRSKWDRVLFWGLSTWEMKSKIKVPDSRPLADFLPAITIKAKDLATEVTNHNLKARNLHWEERVTEEHVRNNQWVRDYLKKSWIVPEELPPEEDLKKIERWIENQKLI